MEERQRVLAHIEFTRTEVPQGSIPSSITYRMKKQTPVGLLEAEDTVAYPVVKHHGVEFMDGHMFKTLSEALIREEIERLLESTANSCFGLAPICAEAG